jgi:hypothetical protein
MFALRSARRVLVAAAAIAGALVAQAAPATAATVTYSGR